MMTILGNRVRQISASALALALLLSSVCAAMAQTATLTASPQVNGHIPVYVSNGNAQALVRDGGGAGGATIGINPSEIGITSRSLTSTYPSANSGNGPNHEHDCMYDGPIDNSSGYHALCLDPNASGGGLLSYGAFNGATQLPLKILVNGVAQTIPIDASAVIATLPKCDATCYSTGIAPVATGKAYINFSGSVVIAGP